MGRQTAPPYSDSARASLSNILAGNHLGPHRAVRPAEHPLGSDHSELRANGDNLDFIGRPRGRPQLFGSGDVNQGREMQVLS